MPVVGPLSSTAFRSSVQALEGEGGSLDADTVDRQYAALQQQSQQTAALIQTLAGKLWRRLGGGSERP